MMTSETSRFCVRRGIFSTVPVPSHLSLSGHHLELSGNYWLTCAGVRAVGGSRCSTPSLIVRMVQASPSQ